MTETIFALSSGALPSGIAVIRISGVEAGAALRSLCGRLPQPRRASLTLLSHPVTSEALDRALVLWLPGPDTVTGDDIVELHCHGGRAVVAAVEEALSTLPGLRRAEAGEFTRRAFENGRMDLNAVEGLSDLLAAETQNQRRAALMMTEGHFSRRVEEWRVGLLQLSAFVEAALDFSDEDDVPEGDIENQIRDRIETLMRDCERVLALPSAERLRDGVRVVLAGPPNAGKSTLLNALVGRDVAIVSNIAGTTRDRIEVPVSIGDVAFLMTDTAGLREQAGDEIEEIGIERARSAVEAADIILWLGDPNETPRPDALLLATKADDLDYDVDHPGMRVSAKTGEGLNDLVEQLLSKAKLLLPAEGEHALHHRQREGVEAIRGYLQEAILSPDMLITAEELRRARMGIDALTGQAGTEDMLDTLFSGFCIGK